MTKMVVTRFYRAPEIALGDPSYSFVADVWSIGCVFAEIISRRPLFMSSNDVDHFAVIFR
jgi:serine/threonine protein kinase